MGQGMFDKFSAVGVVVLRRVFALVGVVSVVVTGLSMPSLAGADEAPPRLSGINRYSTAVEISKATFSPGVGAVFVATGSGFADGLSGGPGAAKLGGPLLLTTSGGLPDVVAAEIKRLKPAAVYILGGTGVVKPVVATQIKAITGDVPERLGGSNRYGTAATAATALWDVPTGEEGLDTVYVANGVAFADALSGGGAAAREVAPLLLTAPNQLPAETTSALRDLAPARVVLVGGTGAISAAAAAEVADVAPLARIDRVGGKDRYETSAKLLPVFADDAVDTVLVASGLDFPDALAGVPASAADNAVLALSRPTCLPGSVAGALNRAQIDQFVLLGGPAVISDSVTDDLCDPAIPPPAVTTTTITTTTLPDAAVAQSYDAQLHTADDRPGTWSITTGALPTGLTIDTNTGRITGTPTTTGSTGFTVTFTDARDQDITRQLTITTVTYDEPPVGTTAIVFRAPNGAQANGYGSAPTINADGRYITYTSTASNLVPGDTNNRTDVFAVDRTTVGTARISTATNGTQTDAGSSSPSISADGRYITYSSTATYLVRGDTNGDRDVFVTDRITGETTRISTATNGTQTNSDSSAPAISADGRYITYLSDASNLVPGDTNNRYDVFVTDRTTGTTTRISTATNGTQTNRDSSGPSISADGHYIAYTTKADNLVASDTNNTNDVFVTDRTTGTTARISTANGTQANNQSFAPAISADGLFITYTSEASNLVANDTNNQPDVFVTDRTTGTTTRVSTANGTQANNESSAPAISDDGRYITYTSEASNLVANDTNNQPDVFVTDRTTGDTARISTATNGTQANGRSSTPAISADGRYITYTSVASNLVAGDTNTQTDVFVTRWR